MEPQVKQGTLLDAYRVETKLGEGGMAEVYKAWNTGLHRHEALKLLPPQMTFDKSFVERFLNEARMAARLRHPHIATIYMVSPAEAPQPYFTMEMVDGGDLSDLLRRGGALPLKEVLPILRQIANALDYAHRQGIVHRDMKPANVLLQDDGQDSYGIKVVDFGIARAQEAEGGARLTKTGMIVGTPEYMSPEQGGSGAKVSPRSDQYSLAVVAYEMLCGRPPFSAGADGTALTVIMSHLREQPRPPAERVPGLPLAANNAILRALSKDPEDRFASCADFVAALESLGAVSVPRSTSPVVTARKGTHMMSLMIGAVVLAGTALVGIGLARMNKNNHESLAAVPVPVRVPQPRDNRHTILSPTPVMTSTEATAEPDVQRTDSKSTGNSAQITVQAVQSLILDWLANQNQVRISEYNTLYARDFVGIKRISKGRQTTYNYDAWLKDRDKMLTSTKNLNVSIVNQKISLYPSWAQVSFDQYFKTNKYGDWGPKVIKIRVTPQGLRIFHEEMLASYPLH